MGDVVDRVQFWHSMNENDDRDTASIGYRSEKREGRFLFGMYLYGRSVPEVQPRFGIYCKVTVQSALSLCRNWSLGMDRKLLKTAVSE